MSALEDLSEKISAYPNAIRVARAKADMSNEQLAERSGVPYSTVCKVQSGLQNITLPQAAAICATLGVSLDALIGLPDSRPAAANAHEMELKLSDKEGDVRVLEAINEMLTLQLKRLRSGLYVTMVLCALLTVGLITYMVIDARIPYAGLIQTTGLSGGAWLFILLVVAAAVVMGGLLLRLSIKYTEENTERGKT